jgi:hypothetical protein
LPVFSPRRKITRRIAQRDKFLFFDIGVCNALLGVHRRLIAPDQKGSAFEQWLILQIICLNRALRKGWRFSSYRTEGGAEVDLGIERKDDILGVEIKSGRSVSRAESRGLFSLAETVGSYKPVTKWLVYTGDLRQLLGNGVFVPPYLDALENIWSRGTESRDCNHQKNALMNEHKLNGACASGRIFSAWGGTVDDFRYLRTNSL